MTYKPDQDHLNERLGKNSTMGYCDGYQWMRVCGEWHWFKPFGFTGEGPDGMLYVNSIAQPPSDL